MTNLIKIENASAIVQHIKKIKCELKNNKNIIFIEPYGASISLLQRGIERNFNIIILTAKKDFRIVPESIIAQAKLAIQVDTADDDEVLSVIRGLSELLNIHAVIPGFEYFVPAAADAARMLNLPILTNYNVLALRNKDLMRQRLLASGIAVPEFLSVNNVTDLEKAMDTISFPAICKPVDAAGSVNVKKVTNKREAISAALRILEGVDILWGHKLARSLLYESYVQGKEYSLEGVVQRGKVIHFSLTEKQVSNQIDFIEIGHIVNVPVESSSKKKMERYVEQVIKALGMQNCPFHAELRLTELGQPILMEIASRLAGDKIGDLINLARGINYFDYIYATYLGEEIALPVFENHCAGIRFFYRPEIDQYSSIVGVNSLPKMQELKFYYQSGDVIPAFPKPLRRLGHVILKDSYQNLVVNLDYVDSQVAFAA